eukprot:2449657-Prymnesium_polylepis.1
MALPADGAEPAMHNLLFEREARHIHQRKALHLPGLPATYKPPAPTWLVGGLDRGTTFSPYDASVSELLENAWINSTATQDTHRFESHCFDLPSAAEASGFSWQVQLSGTFTPYDASVNELLENAWRKQSPWYHPHVLCEISVRGTAYAVEIVSVDTHDDEGASVLLMIQRQTADVTKTRRVRRVGGAVVLWWPPRFRAGFLEDFDAFDDAMQIGPNCEVYKVQRVQREFKATSPPSSP